MAIKIKYRDPKTTDFTKNDVIINVKEGSLFYKSNLGLHKVVSSFLGGSSGFGSSSTTTTINISNNIGNSANEEILFNNNGIVDGDPNFTINSNILSINTETHMFDLRLFTAPTPIPLSSLLTGIHLGADTWAPQTGGIPLLAIKSVEGTLKMGASDMHKAVITTDRNRITLAKDGGSSTIAGSGGTLNNINLNASKLIFANHSVTLIPQDTQPHSSGHGAITIEHGNPKLILYGDVDIEESGGTSSRRLNASNIHLDGLGSNLQIDRIGSGYAIDTTAGNGAVIFSDAYANNFYPASDKKLKKNIKPLENSLSKILKLNGVNFEWKKSPKKEIQYGFIAQEVQKIIPELVVKSDKDKKEENTLHLNYMGIIPILVEALKNQQKQIDELKLKIK